MFTLTTAPFFFQQPLLHTNHPNSLHKIYLGVVFFLLLFSLMVLFKDLPPHPLLHGRCKRDDHDPSAGTATMLPSPPCLSTHTSHCHSLQHTICRHARCIR